MKGIPRPPRAILFDVFGTVFDWRGSIIDEGRTWGEERDIDVDWARFADEWRGRYRPSLDRVRRNEIPWTKLDDLHRESLRAISANFKIALSEEEAGHWNRVWHRLKPWPDVVPGLTRLKERFTIAPLSNGNLSMLTALAKHAKLPWDVIFSADLTKHYKPDPEVYLGASDFLDLAPEEIMLVAAHFYDLNAARALGFQTGFVYRPLESGKGGSADKAVPGQFDVVANDLVDLATQLRA